MGQGAFVSSYISPITYDGRIELIIKGKSWVVNRNNKEEKQRPLAFPQVWKESAMVI